MKPGELERNLSRLVEVARSARDRLVTIEREMTELRHDLETLAARSVRAGAHGEEPDERSAGPAQATASGGAPGPGTSGSIEAHGGHRRDTVPRPEGDLTGPEAGSE